MMKITSVLRCIKNANFRQFYAKYGWKQPYKNLYLLHLLREFNPALFTDYTASPRKSANFSRKTLPSLLHEANNLESFLESAIDYLSTSRRDIDEISLVAKKYRQLLYENPQICDLHGKFVLTLENEAVQFLRRYPGYTTSQNGFRTSLALAVEIFKISPPYCQEYYCSLHKNLPDHTTKEDFLAFLFTLCLSGRHLSPSLQRWVLRQSEQLVDSMSIHNICFLTHAIAECGTEIIGAKSLAHKIVNKTINGLQLLDSITFSCIVEGHKNIFAGLSHKYFHNLWEHLSKQPQPSIHNLLELNKLAGIKICYLEDLTERLLVAINENYAWFSPRKVVQVICYAATYEHGKPEYHLIKQIVDQMKHDEEILSTNEYLIHLTHSMCALNLHIPELIDKILAIDWQDVYDSSDKFQKSSFACLLIIRDYLMIDQYPHYQSRLTNLDKIHKISSQDPSFQPNMLEFLTRPPTQPGDKEFVEILLHLTENVEKKFPHMHLWKGYLPDSATKPSLVMYDNPNLKNILENGQRQPSCLEGCISFEILRAGKFPKRNLTFYNSSTRIKRKVLEKLGIKTVDIPKISVNLKWPDPFHFIDHQIASIKR